MARKIIVVLFAVLSAAGIGVMLWAAEEQKAKPETPLKLSLNTDKATVAPGENVIVDFALSNPSEKAIVVTSANVFALYKIVVIGPDMDSASRRGPASLTAEGRAVMNGAQSLSRVSSQEVKPGTSLKYQLLQLNRLYDMSRSGEYNISMSRTVYGEDGKTRVTITSNSVKVTVSEPEGYRLVKLIAPPDEIDNEPTTAEPAKK